MLTYNLKKPETVRQENLQLTDTQILTIAIAIVFPIAALMYSNKRLDDFKKELIDKLDNGFEHMALLLKLHEAEHHKK